jgi:imidazole glycerol-phosphate synthase subunit HisH
MKSLVIIDYGVGNLRSIEKAFAAAGFRAVVSGDERILREAGALVLPGVGAFGACMKALRERGFDRVVIERADAGTPLLGICVGMQLLFEESEEFGKTSGLGLLRGRVRRFCEALVVPHVGWNQVEQKQRNPLLSDIHDGSFYYFVHSYFCAVDEPAVVLGETEYGHKYASIVSKRNVAGVQFHPEKSQVAGLKLLSNFARSVTP